MVLLTIDYNITLEVYSEGEEPVLNKPELKVYSKFCIRWYALQSSVRKPIGLHGADQGLHRSGGVGSSSQ